MRNPYRDQNEAGVANIAGSAGPNQVYHREAHGLTGEMFDAMLREQFTAGTNVGAREAWDEAHRVFRDSSARAWDEGLAGGQANALERIGATRHLVQIHLDNLVSAIQGSHMAAATKAALVETEIRGIGGALKSFEAEIGKLAE